jgi:hypothetical protein
MSKARATTILTVAKDLVSGNRMGKGCGVIWCGEKSKELGRIGVKGLHRARSGVEG